MGSTIAGEIGVFGYRPSVLMDMLAGKRAEVGTKLGAYMRTFVGDCSPTDLETAFQVSTNIYNSDPTFYCALNLYFSYIYILKTDPYFYCSVRITPYLHKQIFCYYIISEVINVKPLQAAI